MSFLSTQTGGETPPQPVVSLRRRPATTFDEMGIPVWIDVPEPKRGVVAFTIRRAKTLKANVKLGIEARRDKKNEKNGYIALGSTSPVDAEAKSPFATGIRRAKTLTANVKLSIKARRDKKKEKNG
jgi:hypothetical protein